MYKMVSQLCGNDIMQLILMKYRTTNLQRSPLAAAVVQRLRKWFAAWPICASAIRITSATSWLRYALSFGPRWFRMIQYHVLGTLAGNFDQSPDAWRGQTSVDSLTGATWGPPVSLIHGPKIMSKYIISNLY